MRTLRKQREYKLVDYVENDFPLFITQYNEDDHLLHVHDFIELIIVERGKGIHYTKNFSHVIVAGDVLTIPKGMKHGYKDSETLEITNIIFDMSLMNSLAEDFKHISGFHSLFLLNPLRQQRIINKKGFLTLDPNEIARVKRLTNRITREQQEKRTGYRSVCILSLTDLVIFLSRKASKHNLNIQTENLATVLSYMEKNYAQNILLEELSNMVNLSSRSFQRVFNSYMGISPFKHLINIRMQHAKKLLKETEFTIGEIAYATGFGDSAYFTRQFKKIFSTPPSKYRKQVKIN